METAKQLASRLREVILDGKWIANTNFREALKDVTWKEATKKFGALNTIAALTFHIHYYVRGVLNVFDGGNLDIRDQYSFDMPPIESREDWERLKNALFRDAESFAQHVEKMPEAMLEDIFVDKKYGTFRRNIEGVIEHSYYHLGQISLLRKLVRQA